MKMGYGDAGTAPLRASTAAEAGSASVARASAGSLLSGDCLVEVSPGAGGAGIALTVESTVLRAYGEQIRAVVLRELEDAGISCAAVRVRDRGALDFVLEARVKTAAARALVGGGAP